MAKRRGSSKSNTRDKAKRVRYRQENRRFWNKLRRVRKCNGEEAARKYAERVGKGR